MSILFDSLQVHWIALAGAVMLLWLPPYLPRRFRRFLNRTMPSSRQPNTLTVLAVPSNGLDLARALGGTWLLTRMALHPLPEAPGSNLLFAVLLGVLLLLGMAIQTFSFQKKRVVILGPVRHGTGLAVFTPSLEVGIYSAIVAWIFALVARMPDVVLPCLAGALAVCGYVLSGIQLTTLVGVGVVAFPVLVGFLGRKRLIFHHRRPPSEAEQMAREKSKKRSSDGETSEKS